VGGDIPVNSETLLLTDFVNLKIKPTQFFRCAHKNRVCVHVFIEVSARMCMSICICTVFLKKSSSKLSCDGMLFLFVCPMEPKSSLELPSDDIRRMMR
jgi:hypothetical protein